MTAVLGCPQVAGNLAEGEDIEVLELPFEESLAAIKTGEIQDGKIILLLHYASLYVFPPQEQPRHAN